MQPYWFPYLGYFQHCVSVEKFVFLVDANYKKKGWINRNRIVVEAKPHMISVPLEKASQNKKICEHKVMQSHVWKDNILEKLRHAYHRAPFYSAVSDVVEKALTAPGVNISDYAIESINAVFEYIQVEKPHFYTSDKYRNTDLSGEERIIDICIKSGAETYCNPISGRKLYDAKTFYNRGLTLSFLEPELHRYPQFSEQFIPSLSILDILMMNSPCDIKELLSSYRIKPAIPSSECSP